MSFDPLLHGPRGLALHLAHPLLSPPTLIPFVRRYDLARFLTTTP